MVSFRRMVIIAVIQMTIVISLFTDYNTDTIMTAGISVRFITFAAMIFIVLFLMIDSLRFFDRYVLDSLVQIEIGKMNRRMDSYNDEKEIMMHEVHRDLQMIKILSENNRLEEMKNFVS